MRGTASSTHEAVSVSPLSRAIATTKERNQCWPHGEQSAPWLYSWKSRPVSLQGPAPRCRNRGSGPRRSALPKLPLQERDAPPHSSRGTNSQQRDADRAQRAASTPREGGKGTGTRGQ